jgi:AraC family transcriptional regulator
MANGTRQSYEERILRVQLYIQRHLDDQLSLKDLARVACFSPYHFHRVFRGMVGESIGEYLRRLRLERAAGQLMYTACPVTELAFDAGYETLESFSRAFRRAFDVSPSEYRQRHQSSEAAQAVPESTEYSLILRHPRGDSMDVRIEQFAPLQVAFVRHIGPYAECGAAWEKLCSHPAVQAAMNEETLAVGISYDDPDVTEGGKIRYDACVTVGDDFRGRDGIDTQQVDGGDYAVMVHKGSYDGLHDCYRWLFGKWLPDSGREAKSAPSLEIYRNSPDKTPPEELVTEIRVALEA